MYDALGQGRNSNKLEVTVIDRDSPQYNQATNRVKYTLGWQASPNVETYLHHLRHAVSGQY